MHKYFGAYMDKDLEARFQNLVKESDDSPNFTTFTGYGSEVPTLLEAKQRYENPSWASLGFTIE